MCAAPFVAFGALVLLCLSPLAIPLLPVFLLYCLREKLAGRPVTFRWRYGNPSEAHAESDQPSAFEEPSTPDALPEPPPREELLPTHDPRNAMA